MPDDDELDMTISASTLGLLVPVPADKWPETVNVNGTVWTKDHITQGGNGEVEFVDYTDGKDNFLILYND